MLFSDTLYDAVNRNVLSLRFNSAVDWHSFNSVGSWFHRCGAATEKACSPIFSLGLLTAKSPWADTRSADREEISATGVRRSANRESNTWQMTYSSRDISLAVYKCYWYRPFLSLASTARVIILDHLPATASHQQLECGPMPKPDGRPAEHRWRPLFNAAKFSWRPLLDAVQ